MIKMFDVHLALKCEALLLFLLYVTRETKRDTIWTRFNLWEAHYQETKGSDKTGKKLRKWWDWEKIKSKVVDSEKMWKWHKTSIT